MQQQPLPTSPNPNVRADYVSDGHVIQITTQDATRQTVDAFVDLIKAIQQDRSTSEITYFIFDFSKTMAGFQTPYGRAKTQEMMNWRPELVSYSAVIMAKTFGSIIARTVLNSTNRRNMHSYICFTQEEALHWLNQQFEKYGQSLDKGRTTPSNIK